MIREADLALIGAKRINQQVAIYSQDMHASMEVGVAEDEHHTQTLANALALAVDAKDSYTRSHCQTVSQLSVVIAMELGIDRERLVRIRLAGLLHDVGKIGVPDSILQKPTALTGEEYDVMKGHSELGAAIVEAAGMPTEALWVRHHHERTDGAGYPAGLSGDEIPLESRIIHVADAFEAMTSDRPYRAAPGVATRLISCGPTPAPSSTASSRGPGQLPGLHRRSSGPVSDTFRAPGELNRLTLARQPRVRPTPPSCAWGASGVVQLGRPD